MSVGYVPVRRVFNNLTKGCFMFENIHFLEDHWVCYLLVDDEWQGSIIAYAGQGCDAVTGHDEYWV